MRQSNTHAQNLRYQCARIHTGGTVSAIRMPSGNQTESGKISAVSAQYPRPISGFHFEFSPNGRFQKFSIF
jgi:hypothetical protein